MKNPTLQSGGTTGTAPTLHPDRSRSSLIKLLWIIANLRPEQQLAVAVFIRELLKGGGI